MMPGRKQSCRGWCYRTFRKYLAWMLCCMMFTCGFLTNQFTKGTTEIIAYEGKLIDTKGITTHDRTHQKKRSLVEVARLGLSQSLYLMTADNTRDNPELYQAKRHPADAKNIYFIKVHKCGSTTVQNILHRYGMQRNSVFAVFECENGMPFPNPARETYLISQLRSGFNINIISEHARFDPNAFGSYVNPYPLVISSLRHPLRYVESSFAFHKLARFYSIHTSMGEPLVTYFSDPQKYDKIIKWQGNFQYCGPVPILPSYIKNAMAYHFGHESYWDDRNSTIVKFIDRVDKEVDFVIIVEQFDESLLLLKRLFSWTIQYIIYVPFVPMGTNIDRDAGGTQPFGTYRPPEQERELIARHRQWSPADYALYEHYQRKLQVTLKQQPPDFYEELKYFNGTLLPRVRRFCSSMCDNSTVWLLVGQQEYSAIVNGATLTFPGTKWHEQFKFSYDDCYKMMFGTLAYQKMFRNLYDKCKGDRMDKCYSNAAERFDLYGVSTRRVCTYQFVRR